ncbi:1-(5-phosphoribosyl)-5-[(5-phosphoribosylamino) methylideneamino] imidazole-4-carboxamide isomerase, chloroplastic [Tanacetum coccineum]
MESEKYLEGQSMQRPPLFESDGFIYWKNRFETYVKSKDLDLWHVITDGDFPPIQNNPETKKDEVVPFHKQNDDLKKKLAKNNEAKMVIYNALPRKEYERIFMCQTAKEIWDTLLITHQGNNQVKANKIDLLVQQYEQFMIPEEESIDNAFAKFNTIITSLKALDEVHLDVQAVDEAFVMANYSHLEPLLRKRMRELRLQEDQGTSGIPPLLAAHLRETKRKRRTLSPREAPVVHGGSMNEASYQNQQFNNLDGGDKEKIPTLIYEYNATCVAQMKEGYIKSERTKHIPPRYFTYTQDLIKDNQNEMKYVQSNNNSADLFTKSLPTSVFRKHVHAIGMRHVKQLSKIMQVKSLETSSTWSRLDIFNRLLRPSTFGSNGKQKFVASPSGSSRSLCLSIRCGVKFRPCIDIHKGKVKQIVGSTLSDMKGSDSTLVTNFESDKSAAEYAALYKEDGLLGGHVIMLGADPLSNESAIGALHAYPGRMVIFPLLNLLRGPYHLGGLQVGGGINSGNALSYIEEGASHVIITSYVFNNGQMDHERLKELVHIVGKERLVLDLSCRKKDGKYAIVTDRWQKFSDVYLDEGILNFLSMYADEFLVHGVDVEGKKLGIDEELVALLGRHSPIPVTYAGGVTIMDDMERIKVAGMGRVDVTVGSALDIFGGKLAYKDVVAWHCQQEALPV